jgi:hypothetical protein
LPARDATRERDLPVVREMFAPARDEIDATRPGADDRGRDARIVAAREDAARARASGATAAVAPSETVIALIVL